MGVAWVLHGYCMTMVYVEQVGRITRPNLIIPHHSLQENVRGLKKYLRDTLSYDCSASYDVAAVEALCRHEGISKAAMLVAGSTRVLAAGRANAVQCTRLGPTANE